MRTKILTSSYYIVQKWLSRLWRLLKWMPLGRKEAKNIPEARQKLVEEHGKFSFPGHLSEEE